MNLKTLFIFQHLAATLKYAYLEIFCNISSNSFSWACIYADIVYDSLASCNCKPLLLNVPIKLNIQKASKSIIILYDPKSIFEYLNDTIILFSKFSVLKYVSLIYLKCKTFAFKIEQKIVLLFRSFLKD